MLNNLAQITQSIFYLPLADFNEIVNFFPCHFLVIDYSVMIAFVSLRNERYADYFQLFFNYFGR